MKLITIAAIIAGVVLLILGDYFNGGFVIVFMSVVFCLLKVKGVE